MTLAWELPYAAGVVQKERRKERRKGGESKKERKRERKKNIMTLKMILEFPSGTVG